MNRGQPRRRRGPLPEAAAEILVDEGYEPTLGVSLDGDAVMRGGPGRRKRRTVDTDDESDFDPPDEAPPGYADPDYEP